MRRHLAGSDTSLGVLRPWHDLYITLVHALWKISFCRMAHVKRIEKLDGAANSVVAVITLGIRRSVRTGKINDSFNIYLWSRPNKFLNDDCGYVTSWSIGTNGSP